MGELAGRDQFRDFKLANYNLIMKTGLTSSSFFGKYVPNSGMSQLINDRVCAINLKQNFTHERPFVNCKFDIPGNRLYLVDTSGTLILLNLNDNSFSTLKSEKIQNFTIDGNNSLNLLYVTHKSELFQVSFENKKPHKITNLNMNKIRAFERNYLRDMLLALDYKLLFLCDVNKSGQLKIKSLKANKDEVFTNACFASNNRFIILVIKNVEIRIVEIMNLKSVHQIKLPFVLNELKIEVSYDSKKIAIYGDCNIIFFINVLQAQTYSYELIQIPFLKHVVQLRYTQDNDIVFLGSDQILYAVSAAEPDKAVPIFNQQFQIRTMNFDISLDCTKIAMVSNRTVMQLKFPKGIRAQVQQKSSFKLIECRKNGFENYKSNGQPIHEDSKDHQNQQEDKKIQYQDEDDSEEEQDQVELNQKEKQPEIIVDDLNSKNIPDYKEECGSLHADVAALKGVGAETKAQINSVLNNLLSNNKDISKERLKPIVKSLLKLIQNYHLAPEKCYKVLDFVHTSLNYETGKLRHYGLVLCPEIVAIIERKLGLNFVEFCEQAILGLYSNYFKGNEWKQAINWLLSAGVNEKIENLSIFLISILEDISQKIADRGRGEYELLVDPDEIQITFAEVYNRVVKVYLNDRFKNLFTKRKVADIVEKKEDEAEYRSNDARLEQLILRQDEIKRALSELRKGKGRK